MNCSYAEARDQNPRTQPSIPLRVGRSTVAQKIRIFLGMYLHVFETYVHNMRGLSPFPAQKFPIFSNLDRGGVENGVWAGQFPPKFSKLLYIATMYIK